jgi:hypothetical protein
VQYRVTYQPAAERRAETIEADRHSLEAGGTSLVFRAVQRVAFQEREVVVRRLDAGAVLAVDPCWPARLPAGRTVTALSGQAAG